MAHKYCNKIGLGLITNTACGIILGGIQPNILVNSPYLSLQCSGCPESPQFYRGILGCQPQESGKPTMYYLFRTILFILLAAGLQAQAGVRLESSATTLRTGESMVLDVYLDNPNGYTLAGYQVHIGWDAERFQMSGPPAVTPSSVLADFFMSNSPPYGTGWSNCPDAGDGIDRDASFSLSIALSASTWFSGAIGHLYRIPYIANQASSPDAILFRFDEFYPCLNQQTILSDSIGNSIGVTFIEAAVEIIPNLAVSGNFHLGGNINFEIHERAGMAWTLAVGLEYLETDLGSIGTLYFNHRAPSFTVLGSGITSAASTTITVTVPSVPALVGKTVWGQVLTGSVANQRLSNPINFTIS